ncbi:anti-sigma factor [Paraflavitalea pollutisoli]|uniref:anti-sigma factor n=1 Tax=Paraflavitalea pollutisoli TaxID=3034143 RepID=UPI0023EAF6B3|nr:anti-sigma factor [Paraflavitalea sp. H1-2-19X]
MNIKDYISSGIVQEYVLGLTNAAECREFEELLVQHSELRAACRKFEEELERNARNNAVVPPRQVKDGFLEAIQNPSISQSKVNNMQQENAPVQRGGSQRFMAAATVVLLVACGWFAYRSYNQSAELKESQATSKDLQIRLDSAENTLNKIIDEQKLIKDPNVTVVNMVGSQAAPKSSANVFWDTASASVFLMVKNMPRLPSEQQYQLWALIDGQPQSLGVFDSLQNNVVLKMSNTKKADAFAITIEKKGGNPSPTLEKMQSSGRTKAPL